MKVPKQLAVESQITLGRLESFSDGASSSTPIGRSCAVGQVPSQGTQGGTVVLAQTGQIRWLGFLSDNAFTP